MEQRRLGASGLVVSKVGLGCNNFLMTHVPGLDAEHSRAVIEAALDAGVTFFDTSDNYGDSEVILGEVLEGRRDDVVIATKFGATLEGRLGDDGGARGSRRYIRRAIEASLRRLRTDYIDLYQMHYPDPLTPLEETFTTLDDLVREGKVRYIGSSNVKAWQIVDADHVARRLGSATRFLSTQTRYNLLERQAEAEIVPACVARDVALIPYFPLASGLLTGKYHRDTPMPEDSRLARWSHVLPGPKAEDLVRVEKLSALAAENGVALTTLAIGVLASWAPVATVITGATSPQQIRSNAAAGAWTPSADLLAAVEQVLL